MNLLHSCRAIFNLFKNHGDRREVFFIVVKKKKKKIPGDKQFCFLVIGPRVSWKMEKLWLYSRLLYFINGTGEKKGRRRKKNEMSKTCIFQRQEQPLDNISLAVEI